MGPSLHEWSQYLGAQSGEAMGVPPILLFSRLYRLIYL
jgi:hypothetical protein